MSNLCAQCKRIPESLNVETMHTPDRLPKEVEKLEVIGGAFSDYKYGQVRVCADCNTYYLYFYDHDSESGMGNGYTDESIARIDTARAKEVIEKNIGFLDRAIERLKEVATSKQHPVNREMNANWLKEDERERDRLKSFLKKMERHV